MFNNAATLAIWGVASMCEATKIVVVNEGEIEICAKYWVPGPKAAGGGCRELRPGQAWELVSMSPWEGATMWAVRGTCGGEACHTGPPSGVTQFQFTLSGFEARDYYDLSVAAGYNAGIAVRPTNQACAALSCMSLAHGACQAGSTKTCPYGSTDYRVTFKA